MRGCLVYSIISECRMSVNIVQSECFSCSTTYQYGLTEKWHAIVLKTRETEGAYTHLYSCLDWVEIYLTKLGEQVADFVPRIWAVTGWEGGGEFGKGKRGETDKRAEKRESRWTIDELNKYVSADRMLAVKTAWSSVSTGKWKKIWAHTYPYLKCSIWILNKLFPHLHQCLLPFVQKSWSDVYAIFYPKIR